MFIVPAFFFYPSSGGNICRSSGALENFRATGAINIALLTELKPRRAFAKSDDIALTLMYKGKAEQISNPRIAYA